MATIGTLKTIVDWSKEIDPDGSVSAVAELLSQKNSVVDSMMFKEGNLPTGERVRVRTGLPTTYWRMLNTGTPVSKATSAQVDEQAGILTARSEIDKDIVELNGNSAEYRLSESVAFIEAMAQEFASTFFYGAASAPEEFVGLANRYTSTSDANGENILSAGGAGSDNTSIWLVGMGDNEIYGIFPKGSTAGLAHEDLGIGDAFDSSNNRFRAYMDVYDWKAGLVVKDWRYGVRIPNVDISDLQGLTGTQALSASTSIIKLMSRSIDHLPDLNAVKPMFFCNRTVASHLRIAALDKSNSAVTIQPAVNQFGNTIHQLMVYEVPVGINDAITNSEAAVS